MQQFVSWIPEVNGAVNAFIWGVPAMVAIIGVGVPNLIGLFLLSGTVVAILNAKK